MERAEFLNGATGGHAEKEMAASFGETLQASEQEDQRLLREFRRFLCQVADAYDYFGRSSMLGETEKIAKLILFSKEEKLALGQDCTPSPKLRRQVENVFQALALTLEAETDCLMQSMVDMNNEGFGRAIVSSGRLIAVSTTLRAGLRFPFTSQAKLEKYALGCLKEALQWHGRSSGLMAGR